MRSDGLTSRHYAAPRRAGLELLQGIRPSRPEEAVRAAAASLIAYEEALRSEARDDVGDVGGIDEVARDFHHRGIQVEAAIEDRESAQGDALAFRQGVVTPIST
jgi:hypothetical protein